MSNKKIWNEWSFVIMMSLTLGLAPFVPEPHIVGKVRWILGGAHGMKLIDWGDFLMHPIYFTDQTDHTQSDRKNEVCRTETMII
jgi:hypothetical protein